MRASRQAYVEDSNSKAAQNLRSIGFNDFLLRKANSFEVQNLNREFDLVHIDGSHLYQTCLHDLELCLGKAKAILIR